MQNYRITIADAAPGGQEPGFYESKCNGLNPQCLVL